MADTSSSSIPFLAPQAAYSRDALKDRVVPSMVLADADNPLTSSVSRTSSASFLAPSDTARLRFSVRGNAIITGGGGMLALEAARGLLEHGASGISLFDLRSTFESPRTVAALAALRETFPDVKILAKEVDVTDDTGVQRAVSATVEDLGSVDVLLCFAGIVSTVPAAETTVEQWRKVIDINTTGTWICAHAVGKQMIAQSTGGSIVFTASISAHRVNFPQPQVGYNVSKGALLQMKSSLAAEWARYGIRVNSISPGYMDTILNAGRRAGGDAARLAGAVILLCSPAGKYMTGADIVVDGSSFTFP
ncbi:hypothetical protein C8J57DRAFT_1323557, partial [Mycena rebaudengoi]